MQAGPSVFHCPSNVDRDALIRGDHEHQPGKHLFHGSFIGSRYAICALAMEEHLGVPFLMPLLTRADSARKNGTGVPRMALLEG